MAFTYEAKKDKDFSVEREWGFPGRDDAGRAKLILGKDLLAIIAKEEQISRISLGSSEGSSLNAYSGRDGFLGGYNSSYIDATLATLEENHLHVAIGAKHKRNPVTEGGTFSEMYVSLTPLTEKSRPIMETGLIKKIVEYLNHYQFQPQLEGELVPEAAR